MKKRICAIQLEWLVILAAAGFYLFWALHLPSRLAPDERMRWELVQWIFEKKRLPVGDEAELINEVWGYSYGFLPYLPELIGVGFLYLAQLIGQEGSQLLLAARMTSVVSGVGTMLLCLQIARHLFRDRIARGLYLLTVGLLPQFVFLCAYCNHDSFAVFCAAWIFLGWIRGKASGWQIKDCIFLAIGISLCVLTYYNAYGYILCSVLIFCQDHLRQKDLKGMLQKGAVIAAIVIALTGWFFVRNALIHNGDFLGITSMEECGELHAPKENKPSNRVNLKKQDKMILETLWKDQWCVRVANSFVGNFGYLDIPLEQFQYFCYDLLLGAGLVLYLKRAIRKRKRFFFQMNLGLCLLIPFILTLQHSYAIDFQPQGRYLISALPVLMYLVVKGYQEFDQANQREGRIRYGLLHGVFLIWSILFYYTWTHQILQECVGTVW